MSPFLAPRPWLPDAVSERVTGVLSGVADLDGTGVQAESDRRVEDRQIHEVGCVDLDPATNVMNPRAEAMLSAQIGSRPSLGYPGDKDEVDMEAIEQIEGVASEVVAEVFAARHVELRVASGAMTRAGSWPRAARATPSSCRPPASAGTRPTRRSARPARTACTWWRPRPTPCGAPSTSRRSGTS